MEHRDDLLDQLVPAPWSPRRRALATAAAALLVAVGALAWWAGVLGPNVRPATGWSAVPDPDRGRVEVLVDVHNRGRLALHEVTLEVPELTAATGVAEPVPDRIGPGETVSAAFTITIDRCEDLTVPRDATIHVRARSGLVTASRSLVRGDAASSPFSPGPSGFATVVEPVCDPPG